MYHKNYEGVSHWTRQWTGVLERTVKFF